MSTVLASELAEPRTARPTTRRHRRLHLQPVPTVPGEVPHAELLAAASLVVVPPAPEPTPRQTPARKFVDVGEATPLRSLTGPAADPGRVCVSILQVATEVMRGLRPLVQLTRWVDREIFAELAEHAPRHGARSSTRQRIDTGSVASVLARGRLRKVRVSRVSPHVAECTVLVDLGDRVRAVVVRLEEHRASWRATTVDVV